MSAALRGDDVLVFGANARVRAATLFRLPSSYTPGLRLIAGKQEMDALYDRLSELLGRPDALDPESETARQIAEVEAKLTQYEQAEANILRADLEARLPVPLDEIARFNEELTDVLARARDRAAADDPAGNP